MLALEFQIVFSARLGNSYGEWICLLLMTVFVVPNAKSPIG